MGEWKEGRYREIARLQSANRTLHDESMKDSNLQEQYGITVSDLLEAIACLQEDIPAKKAGSETQSRNVERDNLDLQSAEQKERLEAALEAKRQEVENSFHSHFKEKIDSLKGEMVDAKEPLLCFTEWVFEFCVHSSNRIRVLWVSVGLMVWEEISTFSIQEAELHHFYHVKND